jgi:hypothetical protein
MHRPPNPKTTHGGHNRLIFQIIINTFKFRNLLLIRISERYLFYYLQLIYWHFIEILWLFIFIIFYFFGEEGKMKYKYKISEMPTCVPRCARLTSSTLQAATVGSNPTCGRTLSGRTWQMNTLLRDR